MRIAGSLLLTLVLVAGPLLVFSPAAAPPPPPLSSHHLDPGLPSPGHVIMLPPNHRIAHVPVHHGTGVDPYGFYTAEPAPMGIADFGVDANGNNPIIYSTNEFQATTVLRSLITYNANISAASSMTIQLNVVLQFFSGSSEFFYWVQDVAFLDTSTNTVSFENNIWNMSSPGNSIASGSITGNGTIFSNAVYIAGASGALPGNNVALTYPASVVLRVFSIVVSGTPEAVFEYNDGYGWVTYDTASFVFTNSVSAARYTVDGTTTTPIGLYENAELTLGGPGNGDGTTATAANLSMSLSYNNGHNLQQVVNAYNFGSDTAEAINGIVEARATDATNGSLSAHVTHGGGSLANLYDRSYAAIVNITSPQPSGTLGVSGTTPLPFVGSRINLTVGPGNYQFVGFVSGIPFGNASAGLIPGEYIELTLGAGGGISNVTFSESGLPPTTHWSVKVGFVTHSSNGRSILFVLSTGNFHYAVGLVPGYVATPVSGTTYAHPGNMTISIIWSLAVYSVSFTEQGLPAGTSWGVRLNGTPLTSTVATVNMAEPNGSYFWSALLVPGYTPLPKGGTAQVLGAAYAVDIHWTRVTYPIHVTESGLPAGTSWSAVVNSTLVSGSTATLTVSLPNGTYPYMVPATGSYVPNPGSGHVTVAGSASPLSVTFTQLPGRITGLVAPGTAVLTVNGTAVPVVNGSYELELVPGTYNITVTLPGYETYSNATVRVDSGTVVFLNVTLTAIPPAPISKHGASAGLFGLPWVDLALLLAALAALGAGIALAARRRGKPSP
ncbi:MAG: thermopsin family protease [Thermoplasmata archaeon]|nr:thermopsin family protease [Thermoplasmata archaeon]